MKIRAKYSRCIAFLMTLCVCGIAYSGAQEIPRPWTLTPLPLAFYTSDTGIAGGALLVAERGNNCDDVSPFFIQTAGTYTQKHQVELSVLFQGDLYNEKFRIHLLRSGARGRIRGRL